MSHLNRMLGSSNLYHQLMQREMNIWPHSNPRSFSAHLFSERYRLARNLYKTDLRAHYGCVNAIEFSHGGKYLASGGDDKRVLIWNVEKAIAGQGRPRVLHTEHTSNIFCLGFDRGNRRVFSGGNDDLVIQHDFETGKLVNVFKHDNPVYGLSIDPKCDNIFATACEDGQILVFDQRIESADPLVVAQQRTSFHAVEFHPAGGNFLVTANSKRGAAFWDIRKPHHPVIQYGGHVEDPPSCMSVRFNTNGSLILALRRRLPPILYNTQSPEPVCTFYHGNYYNSCTMKSCTFAGENDEFVLSGSDDFNLYVWRVSDVDLERTDQWVETTQMVLYGHRSIVNQVRYNRQKCLLASSGVEKIVKLWSPFAQKCWSGSLLEEASGSDNPRELYSPYNFTSMSTPPHSWSHMSHDYSSRNTNEDPRMMAFFDSLIQQEIEGWDTNSSTNSSMGSEGTNSCSSSSDSSDSSLDDESDDDDDDGDDGADRSHGRTCTRDRDRDNHDNIGDTAIQTSNTTVRERPTRHVKRHLIKRKEYKRRKSVFRKKVKLQRHKYANRIAYLIATKRSRLRRLAIRGASLSNRRPFKIVKVRGTPKSTPNCSKPTRARANSKRHAAHRMNLSQRSNLVDTDAMNVVAIASTSTAAAAGQSMGNLTTIGNTNTIAHRYSRRKYKKHCVYDTSSDDGRETSTISTIPSNAPSTSTGITTTLKDDIIRLRQQQQHIIDSDEYEDDDEPISSTSARQQRRSQGVVEVVVDPTVQPTKKLNGVRRANDAAVMERSSRGEPSVNTERLVNGVSETHRPRYTRNSAISTASAATVAIDSQQALSSDSSSTTTAVAIATTMLPHTNSIETVNANNTNNSNGNSSGNYNNISHSYMTNRRRRPHIELLDNYSSHSNSRLSNSSCQDDGLDSSPSSSNEIVGGHGLINAGDRRSQQYSTPVKRRKLTAAALNNEEAESHAVRTLKWNANSNNVTPSNASYEHDYPMSSNHNNYNTTERIIQPIYASDNNSVDTSLQANNVSTNKLNRSNDNNHNGNNCQDTSHEQDIQQQLNTSQNQSQSQNHNNNHTLLLRTPDSGISIATTITPTLGTYPSSNDSSASRWSHANGGMTGIDDTPTNGDVTVTTHRLLPLCEESSHAPMTLFQHKVARVRRNYRKKFADDSDDSD